MKEQYDRVASALWITLAALIGILALVVGGNHQPTLRPETPVQQATINCLVNSDVCAINP